MTIQELLNSLSKWGYASSQPEEFTDSELSKHSFLVIRGKWLDGIFPDNALGRKILRKHKEAEGAWEVEGARGIGVVKADTSGFMQRDRGFCAGGWVGRV